jgi:hypothetical protein
LKRIISGALLYSRVSYHGSFALFQKREARLKTNFESWIKCFQSDPVSDNQMDAKKFSQSKIRRGWYYYFFEETIVAPLATVAGMVQYYLNHPEARSETGTPNALARVEKIETMAG